MDNQIAGFLQDENLNNLVANDETLMAIYPKIKGVPEEKRKKILLSLNLASLLQESLNNWLSSMPTNRKWF